ncbi:flagellar hook-associated protein FlgK [Bacillus salacetis]|uniref:Flagellar hook-associated protein 1 n=1 Tax=Bacillus salacetis TaxID=2315464 RepID=A0A3A1RAY1_9BACI|nr:flagellar hook-associated protein FlgK [Bacillus salacetis]RIW39064.1 flagellar hook-associated protein FlgK [Bacillus salacetis]
MRSTFMGLETAKRGMYTQQGALHTTGHNIANANTPGFTRQRVNFEQTEPYPSPSINRPQIPGQMGTGVEAGSIQRVREKFLDIQYRGENNKLGYWETKMEAMKKMEEVMNEPSDSGLSKTMDMFWQSLQDLAVNPTNSGARSVVRQRGVAVAETFNYVASSLSSIRTDLKNEINVTENQVNSLTRQIDNLNKRIGDVEPHGYLPNDLYDERDRLIDELSKIVDVQVTYKSSGGGALDIADGQATVKLMNENGQASAVLVGAGGANAIKVEADGPNGIISKIKVGTMEVSPEKFTSQGKLQGLIEMYGYQDSSQGGVKGVYTDMLSELDNLAFTFAKEFNEIHADGMGLNEIEAGENVKNVFFTDPAQGTDGKPLPNDADPLTNHLGPREGFASRIGISQVIKDDLDNIASASGERPDEAAAGDSSVVLELADLINKSLEYKEGSSEEANFRNYYEGVIGNMAVISQESVRLTSNSDVLRQAVDERRMSVSGVSLDEEMTNMIKFQHAYNASARMITLQDEMLDKIVNGMGTGGR